MTNFVAPDCGINAHRGLVLLYFDKLGNHAESTSMVLCEKKSVAPRNCDSRSSVKANN